MKKESKRHCDPRKNQANSIANEIASPLKNAAARNDRIRKGITLLELLISSMLLALVLLSAYSAFFTGRNGYKSIQQRAEQNQYARVFLNRIATDLRNSFAFSPADARFRGSVNGMEFFTLRDRYANDSAGRVFSLAGFIFNNSSLLVSYRDGQTSLEGAPLSEQYLLSDDVRDCVFSYASFDPQAKRLVWQDSWTDPVALPSVVSIRLATGNEEKFSHEIYLPR